MQALTHRQYSIRALPPNGSISFLHLEKNYVVNDFRLHKSDCKEIKTTDKIQNKTALIK